MTNPKALAGSVPVWCEHSDLVDPAALVPNPRNPNKHPQHQIERLARVIKGHGWRAPVTVSRRSGFIVRGHGRREAALFLGADLVPVDYQDYESEAAEWADLIADNYIAELAEPDDELTAELLREIDAAGVDIALAGFTLKEVDKLFAQVEKEAAGGDAQEDDFDAGAAAEQIETPTTRPGDLLILGGHRLLCGDATDLASWERLMQGRLADMCFTDPPYNLAYEPEERGKIKPKRGAGYNQPGRYKSNLGGIHADAQEPEVFAVFLQSALCRIDGALKPGAAVYLCLPAGWEARHFWAAWEVAGWHHQAELVWSKGAFAISRWDYHPAHESILYGWKPGAAHQWFGDRKQGTVWEIAKGHGREYSHPTQKPIELSFRAINNSTKGQDIVLDPFAGSGSTLIAAEQAGRLCYAMEIDPRFCDVIAQRYIALKEGSADVVIMRGGEQISYAGGHDGHLRRAPESTVALL